MATTTTNLNLTKPSVNDAADIGVLNSNFDKIDEKCNPALFAPSGYGLGGHAVSSKADEALGNGFYYVWLQNVNGYSGYVNLITANNGDDIITQTAYGAWNEVMHRVWYGNRWSEWDIENPPMQVGVEYRTTERWQGKAVYTKLVDLGLSASGSMNIYHNELGATNMVRISTVMVNSAGNGEVLPVFYNNSFTGNYSAFVSACDTSHIMITVNEGMVGRRIYATYWYTKN